MRNVKLGEICYEFFTRDIFPDDECIDFMAENNLTINSVRYNACNYLASYGTLNNFKEYEKAKNMHAIVSAQNRKNNLKGKYITLENFIIDNFDNDEALKKVFDEHSAKTLYYVFYNYLYKVRVLPEAINTNEDRIENLKIAFDKFKNYLNDKRKIEQSVKKDNDITAETAYYNLLNYMKSFYLNYKDYYNKYFKTGPNVYYLRRKLYSILLESKNPEYIELVNECKNFSTLDRFTKYHPELVLNFKILSEKIFKGELDEIGYYLLKDENLNPYLFNLLISDYYSTPDDIRTLKIFINGLEKHNYQDDLEMIINMKIILKDYGEISLDIKKFIVDYMIKNNIPVNMYYYRTLLDVYLNNQSHFINDNKTLTKKI